MNDTTTNPEPVDIAVGQAIRRRRAELGLSQTTLANAIGLTFQQVQKYERGDNRVSMSRMVAIADALETPVAYFLTGVDQPSAMPADNGARTVQNSAAVLRFSKAVGSLPKHQQAQVMRVVDALAKALTGTTRRPTE